MTDANRPTEGVLAQLRSNRQVLLYGQVIPQAAIAGCLEMAIAEIERLQKLRAPLEVVRSSPGARVKQDAARYQFLRGLHDPGPNDPRVHTLDQQTDPVQVRLCFGDDLDAAVDAAMRQP